MRGLPPLIAAVFPDSVSKIPLARLRTMTASIGKARLALTFLFLILAVNFLAAQKMRDDSDQPTMKVPNGAGEGIEVARPAGHVVVTGNGINYNGGPVLKGNPVPIYIIWYGTWNNTTGSNTLATQTLIQTFLSSSALG